METKLTRKEIEKLEQNNNALKMKKEKEYQKDTNKIVKK